MKTSQFKKLIQEAVTEAIENSMESIIESALTRVLEQKTESNNAVNIQEAAVNEVDENSKVFNADVRENLLNSLGLKDPNSKIFEAYADTASNMTLAKLRDINNPNSNSTPRGSSVDLNDENLRLLGLK